MEKKSEVVAAMAEGAGITQAQASAALDAYAAATLGIAPRTIYRRLEAESNQED